MRTEPGLIGTVKCLACGGQMMAVRVGWALMSECDQCGLSPADAYFASMTPHTGRAG